MLGFGVAVHAPCHQALQVPIFDTEQMITREDHSPLMATSMALQMQTLSLGSQQKSPVLGSLCAVHVLCVSCCLLRKCAMQSDNATLQSRAITVTAIGHVTAANVSATKRGESAGE